MKYYRGITCTANRATLELIAGIAGDLPITGILDEGDSLTLYFESEGEAEAGEIAIGRALGDDAEVTYEKSEVEEQNWNAEFEQSLEPLKIGRLTITQSWNISDVEEGEIQVIIDPKMSFGTGHHESTRLIAELMLDIDFTGKHVLDAGTGTGVLAIIAAKLGAANIMAFDNNEWSIENAKENSELNGVADKVTLLLGDLAAAGNAPADIILANMHLNIILELLPGFVSRLAPGGLLLTSGILVQDNQLLTDNAAEHGLKPIRQKEEGEWVGSVFG